VQRVLEKIKEDTWSVLNKKRAFDVVISSILINFGKLAFPAYIYICYTNILPKQSLELMIVATALIMLIVVLTSFLENIRQNIMRKEKQIIVAEERTQDCERYLSKRINKSDIGKLLEINASASISSKPDYDLVVMTVDLIFALAICMIIINIGGGLIILIIGTLKALATGRRIQSIYNQYGRNQSNQRYKYEKTVSYARMQEGINSMRLNNFEQKEIEEYKRMQLRSSIKRYNDNFLVSKDRNLFAFTSKLDIVMVATIGTFLVIGEWLTVAKLGACILLITRCIKPWNNFVQIFARYSYFNKLKMLGSPIMESDKSEKYLKNNNKFKGNLCKNELVFTNTSSPRETFKLRAKTVNSLKDKNYGVDVKRFCESLFDGGLSRIKINDADLSNIDVEDIAKHIKMIDLSRPIIETNLLNALCCLEIEHNKRLSLYLTYASGLSEKIKKLEYGYGTEIQNDMVRGLSSDDILAIKVIQSLAANPEILIIEMRNIIFGRDFVDYADKILKDRNRKSTIILNTNGGIIDSKASSIVNILKEDTAS